MQTYTCTGIGTYERACKSLEALNKRVTLANEQVNMVGQFSVSALRVQIGIPTKFSVFNYNKKGKDI